MRRRQTKKFFGWQASVNQLSISLLRGMFQDGVPPKELAQFFGYPLQLVELLVDDINAVD